MYTNRNETKRKKVFKKIRKFSDKHIRCKWALSSVGRQCFSCSSSFKLNVILFSVRTFVQCVCVFVCIPLFDIWFAPNAWAKKMPFIRVSYFECFEAWALWIAFLRFSFLSLFLAPFFFCFARNKCEWNDEFYSYIHTKSYLFIIFCAYNITSYPVVGPLFFHRVTNV